MDEKIFNRVEKKYLITKTTQKSLLEIIRKHLPKDSYYQSGVFNIYFDNDNYDLIIQSIEKPEFKEKLRARSYKGYDKVFFEIKTKLKGKEANLGHKRRVLITKKDYQLLMDDKKNIVELAKQKIETPYDIQIAKEVDYLIKHFNLKPKILIYYNRESYKDAEGLRITFDTNLQYRDKNIKFTKSKENKLYFEGEHNVIMEVKAGGVMPLWLVRALSAEKVYPTSFSKIGKIYETIRKEKNV